MASDLTSDLRLRMENTGEVSLGRKMTSYLYTVSLQHLCASKGRHP